MGTSLNRRWFNVASAPGTGNIAVSTALAGYLGLGAAQDGMTFDGVTFLDVAGAWEVCNGCVYTHGTTTLTRGTREDSSTGGAIGLSSATTVMLSVSAGTMAMLDLAMQSVTPGGRLTTESGVPVSTSDRTSQSTIYYTPFVHDTVPLWDGAQWRPVKFAETSLALSGLTSGRPYDVFAYLSSGVLALEILAWTNGATRATAVTLQDGRYCKSGDKTRLLLGGFYTTSTNTTEDSSGGTTSQVGGKRFVSNVYNQVLRPLAVIDATNSWTYNTATWRQANAAAGNKVEFFSVLPRNAVSAFLNQSAAAGSGGFGYVGIGLDTTAATTAPAAIGYFQPSGASSDFMLLTQYAGTPGAGYHYFAWTEYGGGATFTRYGDNGESGLRQSRLTAEVWA